MPALTSQEFDHVLALSALVDVELLFSQTSRAPAMKKGKKKLLQIRDGHKDEVEGIRQALRSFRCFRVAGTTRRSLQCRTPARHKDELRHPAAVASSFLKAESFYAFGAILPSNVQRSSPKP